MAQALYRGLGAGRTGRTKYCGRFSKKIDVTQFLVNRTSGLLNKSLGIAFFLDQATGTPTGSLAASETGSDTFASTGTVHPIGAMAATETGADTFSSTGTVSPPVSGSMAATETGADTFAATGTSGAVTAVDQILLPIIARRRGRR